MRLVQICDSDAREFIQLTEQIVTGRLHGQPSGWLNITKIDNWFDHKWLDFSVPFADDRIRERRSFQWRDKRGRYELWSAPSSPEDLQARIARPLANKFCLSVWISGNSKPNRRGALMVHDLVGEQQDSWYCSFSGTGDWKLDKCKGTSPTVIDFYRERGGSVDIGFTSPDRGPSR